MSLFNFLKRYTPEDAKEIEEEWKKGTDTKTNLSISEQWELEKDNKDFFTFYKEMSSKSIKVEK